MAATVLKRHVKLAWFQKVSKGKGQRGSCVQAAKSVTLASQTRKAGIPAGVSGSFSMHDHQFSFDDPYRLIMPKT